MIRLDEVEEAIRELDSAPHSYDTAKRLAVFLTLKEFLSSDDGETKKSRASSAVSGAAVGGSEFLDAVSGVASAYAWEVMDGLMETLAGLQPRMYDAVMRRLGMYKM